MWDLKWGTCMIWIGETGGSVENTEETQHFGL